MQTNQSNIHSFYKWVRREVVVRKHTSSLERSISTGAAVPLGKSKAVMKRSRRNDAFLLLCPVETCSLKVLTLHDLIKRCGTPALFEEWRKARWKKTYTEDWLPIKNRRK